MNPTKKRIGTLPFHAAALVAMLVHMMFAPAPSSAYTLKGRVVNGTTGEPVTSATITLVNPSGGMLVEKQVETIDDLGNFQADGMSDDAPVYLARVTYQGINYTKMVRFHGHDPVTIDIEVYEPTTSWDNIQVTVPHVVLASGPDTLMVQKFITIENTTSPPRTVYGEDALFRLYLPADMIELNGLTVSSLGIPLPVEPERTDEADIYELDYPIKPGATRIDLSFDLPYENKEFHYREPILYDIAEMKIITEDRTLVVSGAGIERIEDFHGFAAYRAVDLKGGTTLQLTISGGSQAALGASPEVILMPNRTHTPALAFMVLLTLVLVGTLAFAVGQPHSPEQHRELLLAQKSDLLDQMAKLDDLHKTGTLSDQVYKIKRGELKNALAEIYYNLDFEKGNKEPVPEQGAARV